MLPFFEIPPFQFIVSIRVGFDVMENASSVNGAPRCIAATICTLLLGPYAPEMLFWANITLVVKDLSLNGPFTAPYLDVTSLVFVDVKVSSVLATNASFTCINNIYILL
ncbi:hypothetical protein DPMN_071822 [Dreissena polymorpha]|uniref:Uncharacterized protein n=1 Tax=Dreissena polymorpha TaxID=45954 RepID=A0A9D4BXF2_DREPO|nr:hypothetical protein DPMN_071822 [Dreissena polymorpha]